MQRRTNRPSQIRWPSYSRRAARELLASSLSAIQGKRPEILTKEGQSPASSQYQYSNRQSYEKLEIDLTPLPSMKGLFLIDTKMHFVQGEIAQA